MCLICWCLSCPQRASIFHASLCTHVGLIFSLSGAHTVPRHLIRVRGDLNLAEVIWHSVNFQVNTLVFINEIISGYSVVAWLLILLMLKVDLLITVKEGKKSVLAGFHSE